MEDKPSTKKLNRQFYKQDLIITAKALLGKTFVKNENGNFLSGMIVEVEAYHGESDEAAHTYRGKTPANEIMYEEGGRLYVYFIYGMYFCCNIVTGEKDEGSAILIRGIEPLSGTKQMAQNRFGKEQLSNKEMKNLTSGPGKICSAFGITKKFNGADLLGNEIYLLDAPKIADEKIVQTTRIGISKSKELPWRFYIKNNPFVSKK